MARAVSDGFEEFVERVTPEYAESANAEKNLVIIERCLTSQFKMDYMATYGSTGHGTNVNGYSPVDCFAVIDQSKLLEVSGDSLAEISTFLLEHLPDTAVTGGRPVVAVPFGKNRAEIHHVVPAYPKGKKGPHDIYGIPAPRDRWIDSCPGAHSEWINDLNDEMGRNLKPFIRVVKAWNFYNDAPIWSFYVELCVAEFLKSDSSIVYSVDLKNFFKYMVDKGLAPFEGSAGCTEPVYGTSQADKEIGLEKLKTALALAERARNAEVKGDIADAFYLWRKTFNWRFPAY